MAPEWKDHRSVIELLDQFYCWKSTLREYFELVFLLHKIDEKSRKTIFKDENSRLASLLNDTIICCCCNVDVIPRTLKLFDNFCYQRDLVKRVIETNCRNRTQMDNILSRGFSLCKHDSKRERLFGSHSIQIDHPNTMTSYMCSEIWEDLCSRIGSDLMLHILQNMSMFHKMLRNNLLQVTGTIVDKSKIMNDNHRCNGQFLEFLQQLSHLNPTEVTVSSQESPENKWQRTASGNALEPIVSVEQNKEAPKMLGYGSVPLIQETITPTFVDPSKFINLENLKVSLNDENISSPHPVMPAKFCEKSAIQNRPLREAMIDRLNTDGSKETSNNCSILRPGIPVLLPKRFCCTAGQCQEEKEDVPALKLPFGENEQVENHKGGVAKGENMCHGETEEFKNGTNLAKCLLFMLTRYKDIAKKKLSEEDIADKLEYREACSEDCTKLSGSTSINPPLRFDAGSSIVVENVKSQRKDASLKERNAMIDNSARKRKRQQMSCQNTSERKLVSNAGNSGCCNKSAKRRKNSIHDEQIKENKKFEKKYFTVLNDIYRKKKVMKFKPLESQINEDSAFRMRRIMYGSHLREGLHRAHILNNVDPSNKGARLLAFDIFCSNPCEKKKSEFQSSSSGSQSKSFNSAMKLPKNLQRSLPLFRQLIHNYKKLKIYNCLQAHCPSSKEVSKLLHSYRLHRKKLVKDASLRFDAERQMKLYVAAFNDNIPPYKVFFFVKSVCNRVIPNALLQSKSNWKIFYKNLKRFFTLGKHEFIALQMVMKGIKFSHCTWTYKSQKKPKHVPSSFSLWQQKTIEKFILWVVVKLILPLLKSCFYVTESGQHRKKVFYFRRKSWAAIECLARDTCFCKNFIEVKKEVVTEAISKGNTFGCGKIRVIPKANKLRPIINMKCARGQSDRPVSLNFQVERLLHVMKFLARDQPQLLGAAVSDMDEINIKLKNFRKMTNENDRNGSTMYFVASDIECCFDSIPHRKLYDVVKSAIEKNDYLIRKFSTTSFVMFKECLTVTKRVSTRDTAVFPTFIEKYLSSKECTISNSVIADGVFYAKGEKDVLCSSLWRHIMQSYVQFGSRYYRLERGIAQGSIISTYLCNIFYGHLEHTHLREFMSTDKCILMRWTDDYLLITTSKHLAEKFLEKVKVGFPEYGCFVNIEKSRTNLRNQASIQANDIQHINASWFPWCNLLINMETLEVRFSYDRFVGKSVGDSVSLRLESRPGRRMLCRMMQHVRIQTTTIIFDPALNSLKNILTNAYQIFSFVAIKLNHQIINLPKDGQPNSNPKFFFLVIHCIFKAFYRQYRRVHGKVCSNHIPLVSKNDMKSLYYIAILNVFNKRKTRYIKLINLIWPNAKKCKSKKIDYSKIEAESKVFDMIR